jgi:competence protein ComGC
VEETVARVHFALVELSIVLVTVMVLLLKTVAEYAALSGPLALTRMKYFVTMV